MERFKKLSTAILIPSIIITLMLILIFKADSDISKSERRKLLKQPSFSLEKVFEKKYFPKYETYLLDQFPFRDDIRRLKSFTELEILAKKDSNGLFYLGDNIFKNDKDLDEKQLALASKKINSIIDAHPEAHGYYYSIIADKNYFIKGYLGLDSQEIANILSEQIRGASYIDILPLLSLDMYYKTDPHWSQTKIEKLAKSICENINDSYTPLKKPNVNTLKNFHGAYHGQLTLNMPSDDLEYITSDSYDELDVSSIERDKAVKIYDETAFEHIDPYDFFLGGAQAIIYIENKNAKTDRELILFRDSFGSSIAPLLVENYSKITLVDIRYISSKNADDYLDFQGADVLFLYSSKIYNSGAILK